MMNPENIQDLIHKYLTGAATLKEQQDLNSWYEKNLNSSQEWAAESYDEENEIKAEMLSKINAAIDRPAVRRMRHLYKYAAAASILLFAGSFYFFHALNSPDSVQELQKTSAALPGGTNGAVLTLADGSKVLLDSVGLKQTTSKIAGVSSYNDSILKYENSNAVQSDQTAYNKLTTPYGKQFSLILSDGTKVFMNAGSTLEYPVVFKGTERLVKLSGEAYFEVVHNSSMPFRIKAADQLIEDIGTAFNVNAYQDEKHATVTLVEGSVKVKKNGSQVILNPQQQSVTMDGSSQIQVGPADYDSALAWKNGLFHFKDQQLSVVLKQIARWYNLEIEYQRAVPSKIINGEIYRNMDGTQVLAILKSLGVDYKIEGNKLIVK